jgi:NADH-quinone oxidoreductase subunit H
MDPVQAGKAVINFLDVHPWILITLIAHGAILGAVAYLILLERKIASWVQDRIGPNRVGLGFGIIPILKDKHMMGLGQPLADGVKFILKEDYRPRGADQWLFSAAPMMMIVVVIISIAVLPWGGIKQTTRDVDVTSWVDTRPADLDAVTRQTVKSELPIGGTLLSQTDRVEDQVDSNGFHRQHQIATITYRYNFQTASLNIGVLFVLAVLSLAVYGVVIGGWASNNKYSFLGGLRATANMISYEIPLGLAVLCVVIVFGTLNLEEIVNKQAYSIWSWNIWSQPFAFIMFLVCIHAEANRAPFDMAEAEQELVGGYHTEYSAMRFALFFLGEYAGMITTSVVCVALFFGGWQFPGIDRAVVWVTNAVTNTGAWVGHDPNNGLVNTYDPAVTNSLVVCIVRSLVIFTKTLVVIFVFMWVRWSLPRFRFDQLMNLAWRGLIPISLALLMVTAIVVYYFGGAAGTDSAGSEYYLSLNTGIALGVANWLLLAGAIVVGALLPSIDTNRKIPVPRSRYLKTPLPAGVVSSTN